MATNATFPAPKDPADSQWYQLRFGEKRVTLVGLAVSDIVPEDGQGQGTWTTPGDMATGGPLVADNGQLTPHGFGVAMLISGGVPGSSYGRHRRGHHGKRRNLVALGDPGGHQLVGGSRRRASPPTSGCRVIQFCRSSLGVSEGG